MSPSSNAINTTSMGIDYSDAISVAMNHPPLEAGAYGVKYFDGSTGSAFWNGESWHGRSDVARYSGRPLLLTREEKKQHIDNILAAKIPFEPSEPSLVAAKSALALARHYALKVEKNRTGSKVGIHMQNMFGFYLLANNLGIHIDADPNSALASITDKKLFAWVRQEIAEEDRDRIEKMIGHAGKPGAELESWLKGSLT